MAKSSLCSLQQLFTTLALMTLLTSCLFQESENFVDVDKSPNLSNIPRITYSYTTGYYVPVKDTLWLDNANTSTIYLRAEGGSPLGLELKVDDHIISCQSSTQCELSGYNGLTDGAHTVKVTAYVKSGTRSLADAANAEVFTAEWEYVLMVGRREFEPKIIRVVQKDGTVKLTWRQYPYGDFTAYEIRKQESSGYYGRYRKLVITNQNQTTLNDTTYVGDWAYYRVAVIRAGAETVSDEYNVRYGYHLLPEIKPTPSGRMKLTWSAPPFYKNVKSYTIQQSANYNTTPITLGENISPDQLSLEFDLPITFGKISTYYLTMHARVDDPGKIQQDKISVLEELTIGDRIPTFDDIEYNPAENAFYGININLYYNEFPNALFRLDEHLNVTDTILLNTRPDDAQLVQSPDGSHVYAVYDMYITEIDRQNKTLMTPYHCGTILESSGSYLYNFSASNNSRVACPDNYGNINVYDYANKSSLFKTAFSKSGAAHLSADGNLFAVNSNLYSFNGTTFVLQRSLPYTGIRFLRFIENTTTILVATATQVFKYDYSTDTQLSAYLFETPEYSMAGFNHNRQMYSVKDAGAIKLLDVTNGIVRSVPVDMSSYYSRYYAVNDYLFYSSITSMYGFGLKIY